MEIIKKKFSVVLATGTTTGCTGNCYVIIPYSGSGVTYNTNILLKANVTDWGVFDTIDDENATGFTANTSATTYIVSGTSSSRLSELRKYSKSGDLSKLYFTSIDESNDGLDITISETGLTANTYVYYLGGITYVDYVTTGGTSTIFYFESLGEFSPAFSNLPIIKNEEEQNLYEKPLIDNNVFIIREEVSAFEKNYRLKNIRNLTELQYYAGGAYFNIIENI